jgi:hypothetical protein
MIERKSYLLLSPYPFPQFCLPVKFAFLYRAVQAEDLTVFFAPPIHVSHITRFRSTEMPVPAP